MRQKAGGFLLPAVGLLAAWIWLIGMVGQVKLPKTDMAAVNRMAKEVAGNWESGQFAQLEDTVYPFVVLSSGGVMRYRSNPDLPDNLHDMVKAHMTVLDVENQGRLLGKLALDTGYGLAFAETIRQLMGMLLVLMGLCFGMGFLYWRSLQRRIVIPFQHLQGFARHVAAGNLDFPLPMDRNHNFGAFTESFDLMRDQIKEARRREEQESKSKRELAASLSHDIKTPVTSIKLVSELLLATEPEGGTRTRIQTIYQKADQIDRLATNLLQTSLEDLRELQVSLTEENSQILEELLRDADCYGELQWDPVPGCMIRTDKLRLCQVLDNVIYNSYKYAKPPITVSFSLDERTLTIVCRDLGEGVLEEELPLLFQKYYRGSNSLTAKAEGSGLGLYIASHLMNQMGGGIWCYNWEQGFCTELILPLVLPEHKDHVLSMGKLNGE